MNSRIPTIIPTICDWPSEKKLTCELNLSRVARAGDPAEIGIAQGHSWSVEVCMIQNIERFTVELKSNTFADRELFVIKRMRTVLVQKLTADR